MPVGGIAPQLRSSLGSVEGSSRSNAVWPHSPLTIPINPGNILTRYSSVLERGSPAPSFLFWSTSLSQQRLQPLEAPIRRIPGPLSSVCVKECKPFRYKHLQKCSKIKTLTTFRINTYGTVDSKQLYLPLESTLAQKSGGRSRYG